MPVQRENAETQVKQIKNVPLLDCGKAKFPAWKQNFLCLVKLYGLFGIIKDGVDVPVADETVSIAALQKAFPRDNVYKSISLPGTFSHGLPRITVTVILYATLPHQLRDGGR